MLSLPKALNSRSPCLSSLVASTSSGSNLGYLLLYLHFPGLIIQLQAAQGFIHASRCVTAHPCRRSSAIGADIPRQFQEPVAVLTVLLEFSMATRANLPIILYAPFTSRAKG